MTALVSILNKRAALKASVIFYIGFNNLITKEKQKQ